MKKGRPFRGFSWLKSRAPAPIASDGLDRYTRTPLFGEFANGYNAFGPYRRPILDATGGGQLVLRSLNTFSPNTVISQTVRPVAITGNGSELTGEFNVIGLINVNSAGTGST